MKLKPLALAVALAAAAAPAFAGVLPLNVRSAGESTFYEHFSDGFFRMDLFSPNRPLNQSFHAISDPSIIYNVNYDGFPNDYEFRFGNVVYDESAVPGGTGFAPVTGLTFNMANDPADPTYLNFRRFTMNTLIDEFEGEVELVNNQPVNLNLTAELRIEAVAFLSATEVGYYPGELAFDGDLFTFTAEGTQTLDTVFGTGPVHLQWDFSGKLKTLVPDYGDYNLDGRVDGDDFLTWQRTLGAEVEPDGAGADGDSSGFVDGPDLAIWQQNYGFGVGAVMPAAAPVPEPTSAALALVAGGGLVAARRRLASRRGPRTS